MNPKFPWLRMRKRTDPELPYEPPLWMKNISNGEYFRPQSSRDRKLRKFVLETAAENARRVGMDRREFLASSMGMATTLLCINAVSGCSSSGGSKNETGTIQGGLCVPQNAQWDETQACSALSGSEFIFDVQTHWFNQEDTTRFPASINALFGPLFASANEQAYINDIFLNSDTTMAILTAWPGTYCSPDPNNTDPCGLPLSNDSMSKSRDKINALACGTQRVLQHFQLLPNSPGLTLDQQLAMMDQFCGENMVFGWKMYPGFASSSIDSRGSAGYFLDEPTPRKVIEHGIKLGLPLFCVHKGLPIGNFFESTHNYPREIGIVAKDYPEATFIIYHSAICAGSDACDMATYPEGPYDPNEATPHGTNALIRSLIDNGIAPNSNVYAEVGSALNQIQNDAVQAQHFFGKLLKYVGTDRVVWGTDCVIYGSPQPFIQWFRSLEISDALVSQYGYPRLDNTTTEGKANKAKIFGLSAAAIYKVDPNKKRCEVDACTVADIKRLIDNELGTNRWAFQVPHGPKTWLQYTEESMRSAKLGRPG